MVREREGGEGLGSERARTVVAVPPDDSGAGIAEAVRVPLGVGAIELPNRAVASRVLSTPQI